MNYTLRTSVYTKQLKNGERDFLGSLLEPIIYPEHDYENYLRQIDSVRAQVQPMFSDIMERKSMSRYRADPVGAIKIENLPTDDDLPLPSVGASRLKRIEKKTYISENVLTLIATLFGEPYSMFCEGRGLINNLIPSQTTASDFTGLGAASDLKLHIENSALRFLTGKDCSPTAMFLLGVKQDANPPYTRLSDTRAALTLLSPSEINALCKPVYKIRLPYRWRTFREGYDQILSPPIALIQETVEGLTVNAAFYGDMIAEYGNAKCERAAKRFEAALDEVALNEIVTPGELLCMDNRITLHARTPFNATFDAHGRANRWVQRLFVTDRLDCFAGWESTDNRVFSPTFALETLRATPLAASANS